MNLIDVSLPRFTKFLQIEFSNACSLYAARLIFHW